MTPSAGFADTVPLWFRSEAFAEDLADPAHAAAGLDETQPDRQPFRIDPHVLSAGAAVLRQTLQALKLQRW
jgi:hypothetical protein